MDVADGAALSHWLEEYRAEERPPLRGVVHAAGVLEPAPALEVNADRLLRHLRPKLGGALELERALADEPLDFFVLFSSGSAVVASPQLGEYAAANACLDAVAERRRAAGKPALSIAWGPWGEAGMLFDAARQAGRLFQVMGTMKSADALELMQQCATERNDPIAALYTMRCAKLLQRPPPGDWDGVWTDAEPVPVAAAVAKTPSA